MQPAQELDQVSPGIFVWQVHDSKIKADLFSTALETRAGTYIIDPIPLSPDGVLSVRSHRKTGGIFVTNENHARAAAEFAKIFSTSIYLHDELRGSPAFRQATGVHDGEMFSPGLTAIAIEGAAAGETALHHNDNGGTMVLGDALINFEPHGFGLLPAKYCLNRNLMRRSLRKLLDYAFERILFAHGTPILSGARSRVEQLLTGHY
jgi:hypothetical protein